MRDTQTGARQRDVIVALAGPSLDEPTQLVKESPDVWTVGGGQLYWGQYCSGEFETYGFLARKPAQGGIPQTVSTVSANHCDTFHDMTADDNGVYYYSVDDGQIEFRPPYGGGPYILTTTLEPRAGLVTDFNFVYWIAPDNTLRRVTRSTFQPEVTTLAATGANSADIVVDSSFIYWLDDTGLMRISKNCSPLPCASKSRLSATSGRALLVRWPSLTQTDFYWVTGGAPSTIRHLHCAFNPLTGAHTGCASGTLYTAETGGAIGELAIGGGYLFWIEYIPSTTENRLRRMPLAGGSVENIAFGLQGSRRVATDSRSVYFEYAGGIARLPLNASAATRDLSASAWEVTQAIQSLNNDVPLVAGKTTYVRVYGRQLIGAIGSSANVVEARLEGYRDGQPLPGSPLLPLDGAQNLPVSGVYNRANRDDGWLFQLPPEWTQVGPTTLVAAVDPRRIQPDSNRDNNMLTGTFEFVYRAPACTIFIPVRTHAPRTSVDDPNFWRMIDVFKRLWPVPEVWVYFAGFGHRRG